MKSISNLVSRSDLVDLFRSIQEKCEVNEIALSSINECYFERKKHGAYYTPADVCDFFWNEFFSLNNLDSKEKILTLINNTTFVEPACGAGIFIFSLIKKLLIEDLSLSEIKSLSIICIDINKHALKFIEHEFEKLNLTHGFSLCHLGLINKSFSTAVKKINPERKLVLVGNPPFIKNNSGSRWKNTFAEFVEQSINLSPSAIAYILPLSVLFSRDYSKLRSQIFSKKYSLYAANFDNIPDSLFKFGKPGSPNTNNANSQRCSILYLTNDSQSKIFSTKLIRWKSAEREEILSSHPIYQPSYITGQLNVLRPTSINIYSYLSSKNYCKTFAETLCDDGDYTLCLATVARNYISFRLNNKSQCHEFHFNTYENFLFAFILLASDIFFEYWLSVGDGFHLTIRDIKEFPISEDLNRWIKSKIPEANRTWERREDFLKSKSNAGIILESYDFKNQFIYFRKE